MPLATFHEGQKIVYPSQGVGTITSIIKKEFKGKKVPYYVIFLDAADMTVMTPLDKAEELGIRAIAPPKEAEKALKILSEEAEPATSDWKLRYQLNLELLKKGSINDIAVIVRTLYGRSKVKELPIMERKLYDNALRLLEDELTYSLDKDREDVESLIFSGLEP